MKKNILAALLLLVGMNVMAQSVYDGKREAIRKGSGTEADPFLIENAQNLAWLQYLINADYSHETTGKYYLLTTDIDLNGSEDFQWEPIGTGVGRQNFDGKTLMFKGIFDGGYHKITNLYINKEKGKSAFFDDISGTVKNLYVEGYVKGTSASGIASTLDKDNNNTKIESCISNVEAEGTGGAAGIVVNANKGTISKSANIGHIKGYHAGGLVQYTYGGTIENCYNTGLVENTSPKGITGGIVAVLGKTSAWNGVGSKVVNSYNVGEIIGMNDTLSGGIAGGKANVSTVENSYYLNISISNSNEYGVAMNADDMRKIEFVNTLNSDGIVWTMDTENVNDGYPIIGDGHWNVNENSSENEVVVYPNPASEYVNFTEEVISCEVFDILGNKVFCAQKSSSDLNGIDVNNWNTGVYFVRLKLNNGIFVTNKLIVK